MSTVSTLGSLGNAVLTRRTARPMDITCCDSQRAVIARNILLLSLLLDDIGENEYSIWCIYYHLYLDQNALDLLRSQAKKLLDLSATMDTWVHSEYGSRFRLCDLATLVDIRKMWTLYSLEPKGVELSQFKRRFDSALQQSRDHRQSKFGSYI